MKSLVILCLIGLSLADKQVNANNAFSTNDPCPTENFFGLAEAQTCCDESSKCAKNASSRLRKEGEGNIKYEYDEFIKYTNEYLVRSYEYFFLSAQFGTYGKDRPGFKKVLKGLSDNAWNKGIEMIKEITKRGFKHHFGMEKSIEKVSSPAQVSELVALAKAAEIEKNLLNKANDIHRLHSHASLEKSKSCGYDAALTHYIEEEILEEKTSTVRTLVGHVNQLKSFFHKDNDSKTYALSLFMFDEHLQ